jgi:ribosome-binding protein aMBF1 (putative translation factor)
MVKSNSHSKSVNSHLATSNTHFLRQNPYNAFTFVKKKHMLSIVMNFCDKLKELRRNHNLSQEQMAEKLCMTQGNYSKYESGDRIPRLDTVQLISKRFEVSLIWLVDDSL